MLRCSRLFLCLDQRKVSLKGTSQSDNIEAYRRFPYSQVETNPVVFMDMNLDDGLLGRVHIELFADVVPRAAENFRSLCTGERGKSWASWAGSGRLHFKGVPFHRIVPGFVVQGGDVLHGNGRGTHSALGYPLHDELIVGNFSRVTKNWNKAEKDLAAKKHFNIARTVAMAASGPNEIGSQFFFNMRRSVHLDGKFLVVGQVIGGWKTVENLASCGSRCGTPLRDTWISDCGQSGGALASDTSEAMAGERSGLDDHGKEVIEVLRPRF